MLLKDKVTLITGASRGIGRASALAMAQQGAVIVGCARTLPELEEVCDQIVKGGGEASAIQTDVTKSAQVAACVAQTIEKHGRIDILVNNASAISLSGTTATTMKRYDLMHQINIRGTYMTSKYCIPELEKTENPHILNLSPPLNMDKKWFAQFDVIIGDEAHQFKSKSLVGIMSKLRDTKYRYGFTGTLSGAQTHKWVLEGLFGPSYSVTKTKELIDKGHLSKLNIRILVLKHEPRKFETYEDELQYIISHEKRNNFIKDLALTLKGNTLILYSRVETHGEILYNSINSSVDDVRKVFFVHGGVDTEDREIVREITEEEENAIIVASYGTFSTGINIKRLHNIIFASPSKSRIRNLQSIGRVLRKGKGKVRAMLYDIADDITCDHIRNYTLNHLVERIKVYNEENFNYEFNSIRLK